MKLSEIEKLTEEYASQREVLKEYINSLEDQIREIKKKCLPAIRKAAERTADKHNALRLAIEGSPELFIKPKTVIFHGVRIGFMKGRGEIQWEDESQVIKLIKKHFPDDSETYIKMTERVIKGALSQLAVADLRRIGVTVVETGEEVIIKPTDSEIDRLVNALLKDEEITTNYDQR